MEVYPLNDPAGDDTQIQINDGGILGASTHLTLNKVTGVTTATGLTVTGNSVLGLNSAVFKPAAGGDSTTFFQVLDADGGAPIFNIDTVSEFIGIRTATPGYPLEVNGDIAINSATNAVYRFKISGEERGATYCLTSTNDFYVRATHAGGNVNVSGGSSPAFFMNVYGSLMCQAASAAGVVSEQLRLGRADNPAYRYHSFYTAHDTIDVTNWVQLRVHDKGGTPYTGQVIAQSWLGSGFTGLGGEVLPETLLELTHVTPYITLHNSTHEDTDGGRESIIYGKGEQGITPFEEGTLGSLKFSHDGTGEDYKGKIVLSTNANGGADTLVDALTIDSSQAVDAPGDFTAGTIQADNGVSGTLVMDDGTTEKITLVFTGGILTSRTVEATTSSALMDWTD